jgi:hypothetical protein
LLFFYRSTHGIFAEFVKEGDRIQNVRMAVSDPRHRPHLETLTVNVLRLSSIVLLALSCAVSSAATSEVSPSDATLQTYPMQALAPTTAAILGVPAPKQAEAPAIASVVRGLRGSKKVAILGIDAFGAAIWNKMRDKTPYLNSLALKNDQAQLRSVLPSVTCVNFGCMITGGSQKTTGITTYDTKLACEDLCSVLRANGMKSGGFGRKDYTGGRLLAAQCRPCQRALQPFECLGTSLQKPRV